MKFKHLYSFLILCGVLLACKSKKETITTADSVASTPIETITVKTDVAVGLNLGNKAPEIVMNSPTGKSIALSSLQGKLVLIDFWASWCGPCRGENPAVVAAYNKYHSLNFKNGNGFEIYSVSLDQNQAAWIKAIEKDKLSWSSHVCDFFYWQSPVAQLYQIQGIPYNFLVNKDGIIIAKNLRGEMLDKTLEQQLK